MYSTIIYELFCKFMRNYFIMLFQFLHLNRIHFEKLDHLRICSQMLFLFTMCSFLAGCNNEAKSGRKVSVQIKKQWSGEGPDFGTGDISNDGVFFSDINWGTGDLDLINVETGERFALTGEGYDEGGYAWMSSFSNKDDQIVFEWYNYDTGTHELRLFRMKDSLLKTLIPSDRDVLYWEPLDWTTTDEQVLVAKQFVESNWELGFVSVTDGTYSTIIELDWNAPGGIHPFAYPSAYLSPDNRYIGFDYRDAESNNSDLYIVTIDSGTKKLLYQGEGDERFLSWNNDGKSILFYSDQKGRPAIWSLSVEDGLITGDPELVVDNVPGLSPVGKTTKGYAYGVRAGNFNTYVAEVDPSTGQITKHLQS